MGRRGSMAAALCLGLALAVPPHAVAEPAAPGLGVELDPRRVEMSPTGTTALTVRVEVPADHHAYLDAGESGYLVPVSVDLGDLESAGLRIRPTGRPEGREEERYRATVLRGKAAFGFDMELTPSARPGPARREVRVRSQICRERPAPEVCYPPRTSVVELQVEIPGAASGPPGSVPRPARPAP